jgi:hypothetical protein
MHIGVIKSVAAKTYAEESNMLESMKHCVAMGGTAAPRAPKSGDDPVAMPPLGMLGKLGRAAAAAATDADVLLACNNTHNIDQQHTHHRLLCMYTKNKKKFS